VTPLPPISYRFACRRRTGSYPFIMAAGLTQLLSLIRVLPKTGCWEFRGARDAYGYGRIYLENKELKAHRYFYEQCESPVASGAYLQHYLPREKCIGHALQSGPPADQQFSQSRSSLTNQSVLERSPDDP
jgi:hypothetical protein